MPKKKKSIPPNQFLAWDTYIAMKIVLFSTGKNRCLFKEIFNKIYCLPGTVILGKKQ